MMENPNCAYFRNNFFCCKSRKYYVNCPCEKRHLTRICVFALTEKNRKKELKKNKKEPKNSDEHIAKNVRNVGKIRFYEKISIE